MFILFSSFSICGINQGKTERAQYTSFTLDQNLLVNSRARIIFILSVLKVEIQRRERFVVG